MQLEYQILIAFGLDLLLGDPRWFPHPVRLIGGFAARLETPVRDLIGNPKAAGIITAAIVVPATAAVTVGLLQFAGMIHPWASDLVSIFVMYTGIAARDLLRHSERVRESLQSGDMDEARRRVGMICGRDTDGLDESEIVRATVESVSENMVDGVTAPLFFAALGGPIGVMTYKAVSTLDSTFGYKSERYLEFGWASAKLDDIAAYIPSRLTAALTPVAALLVGVRPLQSLRIGLRDGSKHPSPNAGQSEAAFAGALGIQLGGLSHYEGKASHKPLLGDQTETPGLAHIQRANRLMLVGSVVCMAVFLAARIGVVRLVWG